MNVQELDDDSQTLLLMDDGSSLLFQLVTIGGRSSHSSKGSQEVANPR